MRDRLEDAADQRKGAVPVERPVAAAERTLLILDAFVTMQRPLSLGDLAEITGLFKSVLFRYLISLEKLRYVRKLPDGTYQIGTRVLQLSHAFEKSLDHRQTIQAALQRLVGATGESAFFYVREDRHRLCLLGEDSPQSLRVSLRVGASSPLDKTSISQVLTEFDGKPPRAVSYGADMVRHTIGVFDPLTASISAPVFDRSGRLYGALSVSGPVQRFDVKSPAHQEAIRAEAQYLSQELGFTPAPSPAPSPTAPG